MSRTYRKQPYWSTDARLTRERGSNWQGMVEGVLPNGNVVFKNYNEVKRNHAARIRTNKIRRAMGKKEIDVAVAMMVEDAIADLNDMMDWDMEEGDVIDWDWDDYIHQQEHQEFMDDPYTYEDDLYYYEYDY